MGIANGSGGGVGYGLVPFFNLTHQIKCSLSQGSKARLAVPSHQGEGSTLCLSSSREFDVEGADVDETVDLLPPQSIQYEELLEVVTQVVTKLNIGWPAEKQDEHPKSKLDERFLHYKWLPPPRGLSFSPDLYTELSRSWGKPFSACLFSPTVLQPTAN